MWGVLQGPYLGAPASERGFPCGPPPVPSFTTDTSPAERETQALLDEAMSMATGQPVPYRPPPPAHEVSTRGTLLSCLLTTVLGACRRMGGQQKRFIICPAGKA